MAAAIIGPALLFALLHLNFAQGITAFLGGVFLAWLVERTGSVLPGMLLHFINNCIAFADMYLQQYAPGAAVTVGEFLVLLAFPVIAVWMIWRAVTPAEFFLWYRYASGRFRRQGLFQSCIPGGGCSAGRHHDISIGDSHLTGRFQ